MHATWNTCLQLGNNLASSPSSILLKHTEHSKAHDEEQVSPLTSPAPVPEIPPAPEFLFLEKMKVGREEMTAGWRPEVEGGSAEE